jgi:hypothetical protein
MQATAVDALARRFATFRSRRGLLGALAALAAPAAAAPVGKAACRNPGRPCNRGGQCCSGLCAGKKGKRRCRTSPGQSICTLADNQCLPGVQPKDCGLGDLSCLCFVTTRGRAVCTQFAGGDATPCSSDGECESRFGRGAVCISGDPVCDVPSECRLPCSDPV